MPSSSRSQCDSTDERLVEYDFGEPDEISLVYAIPIHKSHGSEFPAVVTPLLHSRGWYSGMQASLRSDGWAGLALTPAAR
jgi:ATP-dependent exoDNAse (exonuclease V) alpha subunit